MNGTLRLSGYETVVLAMLANKSHNLSMFRRWLGSQIGKSEEDTQNLLQAMQNQGLIEIKDNLVRPICS